MSTETPQITLTDLMHFAALLGTQEVQAYLVTVETKHGTFHRVHPDRDTAIKATLAEMRQDDADPDCRWDHDASRALLDLWEEHHPPEEVFSEEYGGDDTQIVPEDLGAIFSEWGEVTNQWWSISLITIQGSLPQMKPGALHPALNTAFLLERLTHTASTEARGRLYEMLDTFRAEARTRKTLYPEEVEALRVVQEGKSPFPTAASFFLFNSLQDRGYLTVGPGTSDEERVSFVLTEKGKKALEESSPPPTAPAAEPA